MDWKEITVKEYLKIYNADFKVINIGHGEDDRHVFSIIVTLQHNEEYLQYIGTADFKYRCWYRKENI